MPNFLSAKSSTNPSARLSMVPCSMPMAALIRGLLFGVGALTAASGGTIDAMRKDLGALAGAVAPVGGLNLAYVASPDVAVKIALAAGSEFRFPVLACGALASGGDLHRAQRPGSRGRSDAQDRGEPKRRAAHGHRAGANFGLGPDGRGAGSKHVPNRHRRREANHVGGMGLEDRECTRMGFQRDVVIMGIGSKRETSPDLDAWCAERPSTPGMIREWLTRQPSQPVVRRKPPPGPRDEYAELRKGIAKLRSEVRSLRADLAEQRNGYATVDYVNGRLQEFFNKLVNRLNEISREEMESVDRVFDPCSSK
jgi:hypothetical protein